MAIGFMHHFESSFHHSGAKSARQSRQAVNSKPRRGLGLAIGFFALCAALRAETLTLDQALSMAKARNGTLQAAVFNLKSARSEVAGSLGSFLPTLTPVYRYDSTRTRFQTGTGGATGSVSGADDSFDITAGWRILDSGERLATLSSSRKSAESSEQSALNSLRQVLFQVHDRYLNALRANELLRVQLAQEKRASEILKATEARVQVGDAPAKDILQARADALNARASVLQAQSRERNAMADLKAVIGWSVPSASPELQSVAAEAAPPADETLEQAIQRGFQNRADLAAARKRIDASRSNLRLTEIQSGVTWNLDLQFRKAFAPGVSERSALAFEASMPLFDGFRSKERVRSQRFSLKAQEANYEQDLLDARAEIEAAYSEVRVNLERLAASEAALKAAQENYEAAIEAQRLGAGDVIAVLTAQISLVTAESNAVEARYDWLISEIRLRLVTGEPLPGEEQ